MFTYLLVALLFVISAIAGKGANSTNFRCNGVVYRKNYYDKYTLFKGLKRPYNLLMHKYSGNLFFSRIVQNGTQSSSVITSCHIETRSCIDIDGVVGGHAIAYDRGNKGIYFGGTDGIYKYNVRKKTLKYFAEKRKSIWSLFVRRNFYYIEYPSKQLFVYKAGKFLKVKEAIGIEIDSYFVTRRFEIYFSNKTGLYRLGKPNELPTVLSESIKVRQITQDIFGDIFFCAEDGIYMEDRRLDIVKKVAEINQVYGIAFVKIITVKREKNQLIYSDEHAIHILLPSDNREACLKVRFKGKE